MKKIDLPCIIAMASHSVEERTNHLKIIFERFQKYGIIINPIKCAFGKTEVEFLGCCLGVVGISPSPTKTEAIIQFLSKCAVSLLSTS